MSITNRVTLFGYSASDAEKRLENLNADYELKKTELEKIIAELQCQIEKLKKQLTYEKYYKSEETKNHAVNESFEESRKMSDISGALYNAYIKSTEKVMKAQKSIERKLTEQQSLILIREKKVNDIKKDLQKLIDYIESLSKNY